MCLRARFLGDALSETVPKEAAQRQVLLQWNSAFEHQFCQSRLEPACGNVAGVSWVQRCVTAPSSEKLGLQMGLLKFWWVAALLKLKITPLHVWRRVRILVSAWSLCLRRSCPKPAMGVTVCATQTDNCVRRFSQHYHLPETEWLCMEAFCFILTLSCADQDWKQRRWLC